MVHQTEEGGLKEAKDEKNNIIISGIVPCYSLPSQLKMFARHKVTYGCHYQLSIYNK